jgi:hypothetical protein
MKKVLNIDIKKTNNMELNYKYVYVMVTIWKKHWDNIPNGETYYPNKRIHFLLDSNTCMENAPTLFIKVSKTEEPKAWIGHVSNIRRDEKKGSIHFKVNIERSIDPIDIPWYYHFFTPGWYLIEGYKQKVIEGSELYPPFFSSLLNTQDHKEFEDLVFLLLKLIGIHELHKFERENQRGRADGFFVFNKLAVIYDCTLDTNFEESKAQQIENYCLQLKNNTRLSFKDREIPSNITIQDKEKQVWIITRGSSRIIKRIDNIIVREVSVQDLINIYATRMKGNVSGDELEKMLKMNNG